MFFDTAVKGYLTESLQIVNTGQSICLAISQFIKLICVKYLFVLQIGNKICSL